MPRLSAWHLSHYHRSRSPSPSDRWQRDTLLQFCRNLLDTHASVELASIHPYVHYHRNASHANISAAGGAGGGASSLDVRHYSQALRAPTSLSFMNENLPLIDVVKYAQQCIASNPSPRPKQLYVGEFGYRQGDNVTLQFVRDVLAMAAAPPSRTGSAERRAQFGDDVYSMVIWQVRCVVVLVILIFADWLQLLSRIVVCSVHISNNAADKFLTYVFHKVSTVKK